MARVASLKIFRFFFLIILTLSIVACEETLDFIYQLIDHAPTVEIEEGNAVVENGVSKTFSARASDEDGDLLSYQWSVDGRDLTGETGVTLTVARSPNELTVYIIKITVSDGNLDAEATVTLTVKAPEDEKDETQLSGVSNFNAIPGDEQINLTWVNPDDASFAGVMIRRSDVDYPPSTTSGIQLYNDIGVSYTDSGLSNGTRYYYAAFAYDNDSNYSTAAEVSAVPFAASDTIRPTIINTTPASAKAATDCVATITFSKDMDLAMSIADDESVITFYDGAATPNRVNGTITYDAGTHKITFAPATNLQPSTTYTVTIKSTVADLASNTLDAGANPAAPDFAFSFTTEERPTMVSSSPANTATNVAVNSAFSAIFSRDMNLGESITDDETVITFYDDAATPNRIYASSITYDSTIHQLTFTPASPLSYDTTYTVTLRATITDHTGNSLGLASPADDVAVVFQTQSEAIDPTIFHGTWKVTSTTYTASYRPVLSETYVITNAVTRTDGRIEADIEWFDVSFGYRYGTIIYDATAETLVVDIDGTYYDHNYTNFQITSNTMSGEPHGYVFSKIG